MPDATELIVAIEKMHPQPGDVFVVRISKDLPPASLSDLMAGFHADTRWTDVLVLVCSPDVSVESLDRKMMAEHGWVRA